MRGPEYKYGEFGLREFGRAERPMTSAGDWRRLECEILRVQLAKKISAMWVCVWISYVMLVVDCSGGCSGLRGVLARLG